MKKRLGEAAQQLQWHELQNIFEIHLHLVQNNKIWKLKWNGRKYSEAYKKAHNELLTNK